MEQLELIQKFSIEKLLLDGLDFEVPRSQAILYLELFDVGFGNRLVKFLGGLLVVNIRKLIVAETLPLESQFAQADLVELVEHVVVVLVELNFESLANDVQVDGLQLPRLVVAASVVIQLEETKRNKADHGLRVSRGQARELNRSGDEVLVH